MAGEEINRILDILDQDMLDLYNDYAADVVDTWLSFSGNEGQMAIIRKHILPVSFRHAKQARPNWPESATPLDYAEALWTSYKPNVLASAFSDTISELLETLTAGWEEAKFLQEEHANLVSGVNQGPHSTWPVWRGSPTSVFSG